MQQSRKRFLKCVAAGAGCATGLATWWIGSSQSRAARFARRLLADTRRAILPAPVKPVPAQWSDNELSVAWLGHATVLIDFFGIRVLTDPALASRIGVAWSLGTIGPKRFIAPALQIDELPTIDLVLLSHAHMDHMDLSTLRRLPADMPVITAKDTSDILSETRLRHVTELGWNDRTIFRNSRGELLVESFEVKHWGQRWPSEKARGYNGYILRRDGKSILFGGDTAYTPKFTEVRSRGPYEVAIMPIGAYRPWIRNHCTPEQALEMANHAQAKRIVPIHHQTFRLSEEPMNEPIERLQAALQTEPERLALRLIGETFICPKTG